MKKCISYKKLVLLSIACSFQFFAFTQYWQQKVDFRIDVSLNDREKTLDGFEKITYSNFSPDTLNFIWFHLWPNAYKNDRTAFSDRMLEDGNTSFYFSNKEEKGYINRLDFKVDGITAKTEDHPHHIDIVKLVLPKPLPPGQQLTITTPFHVKLPFNYSRGGYDGETIQATQWYPKPAVYDKNGWHEMPYLDLGEFYSEFGDFDVRISVPSKYIVAATGELTSESIADTTKTLFFQQNMVHDFAWFANKNFIVQKDSLQLPSGKKILVSGYYEPRHEKIWKNSVQFAKDAIQFYSTEVGEYGFNTVTVVQGPQSFGGGMEYPTITVISPVSTDKELDNVIAHEVGHNWFQGMLASNERANPWMDEGLNSFYESKYMEKKYGPQNLGEQLLYFTKLKRQTSQPIPTSSEALSASNYFFTSYHATAAGLSAMEKQIGKERFSELMKQYFTQWKFKHPQPGDFRKIFNVEDYDVYMNSPEPDLKPGFQFVSPFKKNSIKNYLRQPSKDILFISPAIGANRYDKLLVGGVITNYKLPPNNFHYLLVPLYGTRSKEFRWLGKLNYTLMSQGAIRKTDIFLNSSSFSMDDFIDSFDTKHIRDFKKIVPGFRLTFKEKNPRSAIHKYIQWKTFFIGEEDFKFGTDSTVTPSDTSYFQTVGLTKSSYYINQLKISYENSRALYPHDVSLVVDQSENFIRPTITANYFFNYREGGLSLRLFAGKFIYLGGKSISQQLDNDRYLLNMTGANGYEDYTYSDYFIGRNEFEGFSSQQIMMRDGGFKVRTDLLASKIGKTDDWLAALNFNTSVPKKINPLSLLPIKIPLHLFFDLGTYAQAWDKNAEGDRFLYDFGFHIPLFNESFNFYFPILYNKEFGDYLKSTIPKNRFFKAMSFTINFYNKDLKKLNRELEF